MSEAPLAIAHLPIARLQPYPRNARTHSRRQIAQIAASIDEFGFNNPVLIDEANVIMAGHGRVEAARKLGLETVPCVRIEHLTDAQKRAYILADNKLALNAGWDPEILSIELQHLTAIDLDFDVTITGFEMPEIDVLLGGAGKVQGTADPADDVTEVASGPAVTRPGDVWLIGRHRLMCGDARDPAAFARLLAGERAQMVFTDPPYNVKIDGHVCGLGGVRHREFVMASGEMTENEFTDFLAMVFRTLVAHAMDGALHYICMDWRHMREVLAAGIRQRAVEGNARALKLFQDLLARYNPPPPEKKGGYLVVPGGISVEKWEELMKASARMSQSWVEPKTDKATNAQDGAAVQPTRSTSQS